MTEDVKSSDDHTKALVTMIRHRALVQDTLEKISDELRSRGRVHDLSRYGLDEFEGYAVVNAIGRNYAYGTPEYNRLQAKQHKPGMSIPLHFSRNPHHPEYHSDPMKMNIFELMEMVADWVAAVKTYKTNTLRDSLPRKKEVLGLSKEQWWFIDSLVDFLEKVDPELTEQPS